MSPAELVKAGADLIAQLPPDVVTHAVSFLRALVNGDEEAAKRAATSAATARLFRAPVK